MMNTIRRLGTIIVVVIALTGCQKETLTPDDGTKDLGREIELTMSASMSDVVIPTRALAEPDEKAITRLDVLVFKGDDTFAYTVQANNPTVSGSTLSYTVRLKKSTESEKYKLVLLANLTAAPSIAVGTAKEVALAAITFAPTTNWTTGTTIPMWADYPTAAVVTTSTIGTSFGSTAMIRSLARVNVTNAAILTFQLTKVWVYNSTDKARVAPQLVNYDAKNTKVTAPSLAESTAMTAVYSKESTDNKVEREIYIGESEDKPVGDAAAVCLVLEGTFGETTNFYRVDMVAADGTTSLDILRNHTYNVNITGVEGSGYDTKEDAFASMPINITVEIKVWDDAKLNDITTDGQYSLAVEKGRFDVEGLGGTESIAYSTDYPKRATAATSDSWITIAPLENSSAIEFSYEYNPSVKDTRAGSITITAGRIVKKIIINQAGKPFTYVGMFGGELVGDDTNGWAFSKPLYTQTVDEGSNVKWALDTEGDYSVLAGSKTDGRANTWNLSKGSGGSLTGFPAANRCFGKNNTVEQASKDALTWYLPAQEQLMGIWVTHTGSNASYIYLDGETVVKYWSSSALTSSTPDDYYYSWGANFYNGAISRIYRTDKWRVRCVREITP